MTDNPVRDAIHGLEDTFNMVDSARHALGHVINDLPEDVTRDVVACIMRTLDAAAEQGQTSFDIIHKAVKAVKS